MFLRMLPKSTPEILPIFTVVDMGISAAGYAVHKVFRHAGEMIADGEGAFRALYLCITFLVTLHQTPAARSLCS